MSQEDLMLSRTLKANHLACMIVASEGGSTAVDNFEVECRAIVELAGAVLIWRHASDLPPHSDDIRPSNGLDIREPLFVVLSRCNHDAFRSKADELLRSSF